MDIIIPEYPKPTFFHNFHDSPYGKAPNHVQFALHRVPIFFYNLPYIRVRVFLFMPHRLAPPNSKWPPRESRLCVEVEFILNLNHGRCRISYTFRSRSSLKIVNKGPPHTSGTLVWDIRPGWLYFRWTYKNPSYTSPNRSDISDYGNTCNNNILPSTSCYYRYGKPNITAWIIHQNWCYIPSSITVVLLA